MSRLFSASYPLVSCIFCLKTQNVKTVLLPDGEAQRWVIAGYELRSHVIIKEEAGVDDGSSMGLNQDTEYAFTKVDI